MFTFSRPELFIIHRLPYVSSHLLYYISLSVGTLCIAWHLRRDWTSEAGILA